MREGFGSRAGGDNRGGQIEIGNLFAGERVALFGGSFNPIHFGHLISARAVAEQLGLPRIVLIPSAVPPHKEIAHVVAFVKTLANH